MGITRGLIVPMVVVCCASANAQWNKQIIDQSGISGECSTVKVDAEGTPHVAYIKRGDRDALYYAKWNGAAWNPTVATSAGNSLEWENGMYGAGIAHAVIDGTSLTVVGTVKYYIYYDSGDNRYHYPVQIYTRRYYNTSSGTSYYVPGAIMIDEWWATNPTYPDALATFDEVKNGLCWLDMVIVGDVLHIVLVHKDEGLRHYAYDMRTGTYLRNGTTIDSTITPRYRCSLAADVAGNLHLSYYDDGGNDLKYAKYDGSAWNTQYVITGDYGRHNSIVIKDNVPHIFYAGYVGASLGLKHAELSE